jgi:hypothetical protein
MSMAIKPEDAPDDSPISRDQWYAWFLAACTVAAAAIMAAGAWDAMR